MAKPIFTDEDLFVTLERIDARESLFRSVEHMAYYMSLLLWKAREETAYIVFLSKGRKHLNTVRLTEGGLRQTEVLADMMEAYSKGAAYYFLGHTHGTKPIVPSPEDVKYTRMLQRRMEGKMKCLGHFITQSGFHWKIIQL